MPPAVRRIPSSLLFTVVAALAASGSALAGDNAGFTPRDPASPGAQRILDAYWLLVGVGTLVFLVVAVPLVVFMIRYRSNGRGRDVEGPQVRGNSRLEVGWTLGAVLIVTVVISFVFYKLPGIVDPGEAAAGGDDVVQVEGRQFYWRYVYPNGVVAFDTLRLPVDREVTFAVSAPTGDVIHSFWVPELAGKRDAIPGQTTRFTVLPTKEGEFTVICGELCGLQHAAMRGVTQVIPADEYDAWIADQAEKQRTASAELGGSMWTRQVPRPERRREDRPGAHRQPAPRRPGRDRTDRSQRARRNARRRPGLDGGGDRLAGGVHEEPRGRRRWRWRPGLSRSVTGPTGCPAASPRG
jgi:cytochrome c oxidase subunit 2